MPPTAKTLILDLLSSQRAAREAGNLPVAALVEAGELFELEGNNIRVSLARLRSAGLVVRDERGRYRLGDGARAVSAQAGSWRRAADRLVAWRGGWIAVHRLGAVPRPRSAAGRQADRALRLLGFRSLQGPLWVRPDNLRGGVEDVRGRLGQLGLEPGAMVSGLSELDDVTDGRARTLWDTQAILDGYSASRNALRQSTARVARLDEKRAMVETFLEGGRVLRQLARDPWLPNALVSSACRDALLADIRTYDRLGRAYWAAFLAGHGVAHHRGHLDLHAASGAP